MSNGTLIVFEGFEGCGKTTTMDVIVLAMTKAGLPVRKMRCPGQTPLGEFARSCMHNGTPLSVQAEHLLLQATWADLCYQELLPGLGRGEIIFLDRAQPISMLFYQLIARQPKSCWTVRELEDLSDKLEEVSGGVWPPDVLLHFKASAETSQARAMKKRTAAADRMEDIAGIFERGEKYYELCVVVGAREGEAVAIDTDKLGRSQALWAAWCKIEDTLLMKYGMREHHDGAPKFMDAIATVRAELASYEFLDV